MTTTRTRPGRRAAVDVDQAPTGTCSCPSGRATTIARFTNQQLVTVEHRHHPASCGMPSTWTTPADYQAGVRATAPRGGWR